MKKWKTFLLSVSFFIILEMAETFLLALSSISHYVQKCVNNWT